IAGVIGAESPGLPPRSAGSLRVRLARLVGAGRRGVLGGIGAGGRCRLLGHLRRALGLAPPLPPAARPVLAFRPAGTVVPRPCPGVIGASPRRTGRTDALPAETPPWRRGLVGAHGARLATSAATAHPVVQVGGTVGRGGLGLLRGLRGLRVLVRRLPRTAADD